MPDGLRLIGAVDAVDRVAEIKRARPELIARPPGHEPRQIRLAVDHLRRRNPIGPFRLARDAKQARPLESVYPSPVAQRRKHEQHQQHSRDYRKGPPGPNGRKEEQISPNRNRKSPTSPPQFTRCSRRCWSSCPGDPGADLEHVGGDRLALEQPMLQAAPAHPPTLPEHKRRDLTVTNRGLRELVGDAELAGHVLDAENFRILAHGVPSLGTELLMRLIAARRG